MPADQVIECLAVIDITQLRFDAVELRERRLKMLSDEALETGDIDMEGLDEPVRKAFMCYLFLATVQELIIQHLDSSIIGS